MSSEHEKELINFLNAELGLASTFAESAQIAKEAGHEDHAVQAKSRAQQAVDSVKRFKDLVADPRIREALDKRLPQLERIISAL